MPRLFKLCAALALVCLLALCSAGCSLITPYENNAARDSEYTWLGMDALDTAQTITIARSPSCLRESDHVASWLYGSDTPTPARVIGTNVALAYAHYEIGAWIDRHTEAAAIDPDDENYPTWYLFRSAWEGFALIGTGFAVLHNAQARVGPFSEVHCK
jgi:hypothetical protein